MPVVTRWGDLVAVGADAQITDLTLDDHACLTFGDPEELLDLTSAFVRDGLAAGMRVAWLSEEPDRSLAELGRRGVSVEDAVRSGSVLVASCEDELFSGSAFAVEPALDWLRGQLDLVARDGLAGLRVALDMSWALRPVPGVERLPAFEQEIATELTGSGASVLCQYDRERFDPVTLASVSGLHGRSVAAATYHDDPLLRICRQYAPPGIRIAGQLDRSAQDSLARALAEAIRVGGDIDVNMTELTFIDLHSTRTIADAVRGVVPQRRVVLRCHPAVAARFGMLGILTTPGIRVVIGHER